MKKILVFDMDGTIADLYGVEGWLEDLRNENPRPYIMARPMYDMTILNNMLEVLKQNGYRIIVTTWLAKGSTKKYDDVVRQAKLDWLNRYKFPYDEIHLIKYGTTKANCTRHHKVHQTLVDDNKKVRQGWHLGDTIDANEDILKELADLISATL